MFVLKLSLYKYSLIRVTFEENSLFFSYVSKDISFGLCSDCILYSRITGILPLIVSEVLVGEWLYEPG